MGKLKGSKKFSLQTDGGISVSEAFDPALTSLFALSAGPVQPARKAHVKTRASSGASSDRVSANTSFGPGARGEEHVESYENAITTESLSQNVIGASDGTLNGLGRKRKRKVDDDDDSNLENRYLQRLSNEGVKNVAGSERRGKEQGRAEKGHSPNGEVPFLRSDTSRSIDVNQEDQLAAVPPQHESLSLSAEKLELEKASRTVFLGNVSTIAIKSKAARSTLIDHLESFISNSPERDITHKLESIRFRSTAFASSGLPKKAAYAKKELMDSTTKSTNAYAVYTTQSAAREAVTKLNGTVIFDRHLRVDGVAHPAKVDHRRCVFVGNLGFVDDESVINAATDIENNKPPRKRREPADAEEGLWRQFSKAGVVESVRVIRDKTTRVGKGFAYVQFQNVNSVEKALLYNEKKFPPMLPRVLRVSRAKKLTTNTSRNSTSHLRNNILSISSNTYQPKLSSKSMSLSGRAKKLLGSAGAAQLSKSEKGRSPPGDSTTNPSTPAVAVVFEGHRASSKQSMGTMKLGGSGKKPGKPRTRSSKRGAAFKASGSKKVSKS